MLNQIKTNKLSGFSLVEVIIVVGCLAVIVSLSFGDMNRMFLKQITENEKLDLIEIKKAMEIYAKREGSLPTNDTECDVESKSAGSQWHMQLAKYSILTPERICFDQFGLKREYQVQAVSQTYRNGSYEYDVYYATVLSRGSNNKISETTPWNGISGSDGFSYFTAGGDDMLIKFSDKDHKTKLYEETLERISTLEKYLERYARSKRAIAKSLGVENFDKLIFYPKDARSASVGDYYEDGDIGVKAIEKEMDARALAKELGLPEYLGENAITGNSMWYISNPGSDREKPCNGAKSNPPFYPPAVMLTTGDARPTGC